MQALIDGDWLIFTAGFAAQKTEYCYLGNKYESMAALKESEGTPVDYDELFSRIITDPPEHTLHTVKLMIDTCISRCREKFNTREVYPRIYIDGDGNFRHRIATIRAYKGNRSSNSKPEAYTLIREYLINGWNARTVHWVETDDRIACEATKDPKNSIICGVDKDYLQVATYFYNPNKGFRKQTQEKADRFLAEQVLTGDAADNIQGIPQMGPKKARRWIDENGISEDSLIAAYQESIDIHGGTHIYGGKNAEEAYRENLALVYLLRTEEEIDAAKTREHV